MRISVIVKTKNGFEKGVNQRITDNNIYDVFGDIDDIITRDTENIRVIIYDDNSKPVFTLSSITSNIIDFIGLSYIVDSIQKNINI